MEISDTRIVDEYKKCAKATATSETIGIIVIAEVDIFPRIHSGTALTTKAFFLIVH